MGPARNRVRRTKASYIEARMFGVFLAVSAVIFAVPAIVRAVDANGDNLDDAWEAQYGITTGAYDATNLVGWWQMDGGTNVADRTTNQIDGTLESFPTNAYGPGLFSNALYFVPGASVDFAVKPALQVGGNFTFSAWFKEAVSTTNSVTVATWTDASTNAWSVNVTPDGQAQIEFSSAGGKPQSVGVNNDPIRVNDGTWHHVAATYDAPNAEVYIDGESQAQGVIVGWSSGAPASFTFGDGSATDQSFQLDETRLYNRALSASEVVQLPVTYTDLTGNGVTVYEAWLRGLNPYAAYPPLVPKPGSVPTGPGGKIPESPLEFTAWMSHEELDAYLDALDPSSVGKHPNYWDKGHWINAAEGRWNNNRIEYRVAFGPVPRHSHYWWYWWINQTQASYDYHVKEMADKGFTLLYSNSFTKPDGTKRYQVVWHKLIPPTAPATNAP